jgi:superfamily I DNA/RNA helicase
MRLAHGSLRSLSPKAKAEIAAWCLATRRRPKPGCERLGQPELIGEPTRRPFARSRQTRLLPSSPSDQYAVTALFNGPAPAVRTFKSQQEENDAVAAWLAHRCREGVAPHEFGVFVRSDAELDRACTAVAKTGMPSKVLDEHVEMTSGRISIGTMHLAKGLEFRAVVVMACDDEIIPLQSRIETVADEADLEEVYNTERHLLYVACTRARDHLLVTSVDPASEFLDDLLT